MKSSAVRTPAGVLLDHIQSPQNTLWWIGVCTRRPLATLPTTPPRRKERRTARPGAWISHAPVTIDVHVEMEDLITIRRRSPRKAKAV